METIYSLLKIEEKGYGKSIDVIRSFTSLEAAKIMLNELFKAELAEHWEGYVNEDYVEVTIRGTFKSIEDTYRGDEFTLSIEENQLMK